MDKETISALSTSVIAFSTVLGLIMALIYYFKEDVSVFMLIFLAGLYLFLTLLCVSFVKGG